MYIYVFGISPKCFFAAFIICTLALNMVQGLAPFPACNVGPMHHAHMIVPVVGQGQPTLDACLAAEQKFLLSHGATFFCPHTWDIKLLATVVEDEARTELCNSYFDSIDKKQSPIYIFRPTLGQGELPAEALGQLTQWSSPYIYHVYNFGDNNDAGIGNGWNTTTVRDAPTTVNIERVLYSQQLQLMIAPPTLTYLLHAPLATMGSTDPGTLVLTHYITTAGPSGFDHILTVKVYPVQAGQELPLRSSWPLFITFAGYPDSYTKRLNNPPSTGNYSGVVHIYDEITLEPTEINVNVTIDRDYYSGVSDGFAGFGTICPPIDDAGPSPSMCLYADFDYPSAQPTLMPDISSDASAVSDATVGWIVGCTVLTLALGVYYYYGYSGKKKDRAEESEEFDAMKNPLNDT